MYGSSKSHKLKTTEVKPWSFSRPKAQKASSRLNVFCEIAQHRMFAFFFLFLKFLNASHTRFAPLMQYYLLILDLLLLIWFDGSSVQLCLKHIKLEIKNDVSSDILHLLLFKLIAVTA